MKTVSMLLESKGNDVWSVSPGATVYDALVRMAEKNVGVPFEEAVYAAFGRAPPQARPVRTWL